MLRSHSTHQPVDATSAAPKFQVYWGLAPQANRTHGFFSSHGGPLKRSLSGGQTTANLHRDSRPGRFIVTPCSPKSELLSPPASSLAGLSTGPRVEPRSRLSTPNL